MVNRYRVILPLRRVRCGSSTCVCDDRTEDTHSGGQWTTTATQPTDRNIRLQIIIKILRRRQMTRRRPRDLGDFRKYLQQSQMQCRCTLFSGRGARVVAVSGRSTAALRIVRWLISPQPNRRTCGLTLSRRMVLGCATVKIL